MGAVSLGTFGSRLKERRESQGITLEAIAESTKIRVSLLAALERNDLSQWPSGIFRRAFIREYAAAIGLPPEPTVVECLRLLPEDGSGNGDRPIAPKEATNELRLTLEVERWRAPMGALFRRFRG